MRSLASEDSQVDHGVVGRFATARVADPFQMYFLVLFSDPAIPWMLINLCFAYVKLFLCCSGHLVVGENMKHRRLDSGYCEIETDAGQNLCEMVDLKY